MDVAMEPLRIVLHLTMLAFTREGYTELPS